MLDNDLAEIYQVSTKRLNEAVKRNADRFPKDFMFQLNEREFNNLRFQFGILNLRSQIATSSYGGRRYLSYAFTEHGVAMLSSVLRSRRAVQMNILIIRAFVKLREMLATNKDLAARVNKLELTQKEHTSVLVAVVKDIQRIKNPTRTNAIGFKM